MLLLLFLGQVLQSAKCPAVRAGKVKYLITGYLPPDRDDNHFPEAIGIVLQDPGRDREYYGFSLGC